MSILQWRHGILPLGILISCAALGLGTAYAVEGSPWSTVVSTAPGASSQAAPHAFPVNAGGLTYGSLLDSTSSGNQPDLILVVATNGAQGYVKRNELASADGDPSNFHSPQEALAWQASHQNVHTSVTVYAVDGQTPLGVFDVAAAPSGVK